MEEIANQSEQVTEETTTTEETTEQVTDETTQQETEGMTQAEKEAFLKVKYNKQEIELDREKAIEYAQKGLNYDKIKERLDQLESDPRLTFVEQQAQKYNMTVEQYLDAVKQQEEQAKLDELVQQNIPEEFAKEIMENRKFREQYQTEKQAREAAEKRENDYKAFLETYPDVKPEDIPESVWEETRQGKSLVDAYTKHENQKLKEQLAELQEGKEIEAKNEENANATTGPVKGGDGKQPYFTKEQVEKMSTAEINKNWKAIMESQKQWFKE